MSETLIENGLTEKELPSPPGQPAWTRSLRQEAFELFRALPIPSQETEEWRYTDLSGLDLDAFAPFASGRVSDNLDGVAEEVQEAVGELGERAGLLVQHNSETATVHLSPEDADRGVIFVGLDRALAEHADLLEKRLHRLVPAERTKFLALHAAFRTGGVFVYVPAGVRVELPLQSLTYVDAEGLAVFPHTLIVAEQGAEVTFIERFVSRPLERALSDAVTEVFVGPGARVRYVSLQDWGEGMTHLSVQRAVLDRDAELRSLAVAFGGSLSRTEVESVLSASGGHSEMLGVYFTDGSQHFDHRSLQDHVAPNCGSEVLYKGALKGRSRAVYSGWVHVRKDAQKTNAFQTNRNIVLSDEAKADSIPNLEIEANDVRCGHAASVGPVDEDVRFYMQSRGIPADEAERLIVTGFFQEVLDRVPLPEVRESLEQAIEDELERSD
ncbi:MAG TPA: Fe-S cluster assembly protein SufD [Actinomycetota bacterium]|nr:Fe-S cluster assembly protein SufD [Actinomycetota bacterium]